MMDFAIKSIIPYRSLALGLMFSLFHIALIFLLLKVNHRKFADAASGTFLHITGNAQRADILLHYSF
jgi:hypothetical protein